MAATPRVGSTGTGFQKGDLYVVNANGDLERVPVAADGQYLTADSTSALGVSYKNGANRAIIFLGGASMGGGDAGKYFGAQDTSNGGKNAVLSSDNQMASGINGTVDLLTWESQTAAAATVFKIAKNGLIVATFNLTGVSGSVAIAGVTSVLGDLFAVQYSSGTAPGRTTTQLWARR